MIPVFSVPQILLWRFCIYHKMLILQWRIQAILETGIPIWASKLCPLKSTFQVFFFQLYFNKKNMLNWWSMILQCIWLFKNGLEYKNADRREKQWDIWVWNKRRNCQQKCIHSFNCVKDHKHICFSFYINSLHCFVQFLY